jgi:hypothetical protein
MGKFAILGAAVALSVVAQPSEQGYAADMSMTAGKVRPSKTKLHRTAVVRDPCLRARLQANRLHPYDYDPPNLVYVHGNSYRAGFCIDGDRGPAYRPFWAWGY